MPLPGQFSFTRYLSAKKSVDDRALNQSVWNALAEQIAACQMERPLRVLEVGAGIGTMLERCLERDLFRQAVYTAIDAQADNIAQACLRLPDWAAQHGIRAVEASPGEFTLESTDPERELCLSVRFETIDLFDFIRRVSGKSQWDLLIAHAFLDLMDVPATLPGLFSMISRGGWGYFSLNFDGASILEPAIDPVFDQLVEQLYHRSMDERLTGGKPSGDSQAGRHLFGQLRACGASLLAAGASDWVVFAGPHGYAHDEAYFLHFIIHTIQQALQGHPELEASRFNDWIAARQAQIERHELVYIAHQLDFLTSQGA